MGAAWLSAQVRIGFTGGDVTAPYVSISEMGLHSAIWIGLALGLRHWRPDEAPSAFPWAETLALGFGAGHALIAGVVTMNPWWGIAPGNTGPGGAFLALLVGYGAPAGLLAAYAMGPIRHRTGLRLRIAGAAAGGLALTYLLMLIRSGFAGAAMATAPTGIAETWAYTLALIIAAGGALLLGRERGSVSLRIAALVLALGAVAKASLFDLSAASGGLRLLGAAAGLMAAAGVVWFFQKYVFGRALITPPSGVADPNLMPPR